VTAVTLLLSSKIKGFGLKRRLLYLLFLKLSNISSCNQFFSRRRSLNFRNLDI